MLIRRIRYWWNRAEREESGEVWIARGWTTLGQDLRYAFRGIARNPGFAAVAIISAGAPLPWIPAASCGRTD